MDDFRLLLEHGADPRYKDDREFNALHVAASHCFYDGAKAILDHLSADEKKLKECLDCSGFSASPLMLAINRCSVRLVNLFLDHGANILVSDFRRRTAIDYALQPKLREQQGRIAIADALFRRLAQRKHECGEASIKGTARQLRRTDPELFTVF
ncbi:hypothetical protein HDU96_005746 [Phlyctochytrium bullatum]|nr:hypothetical protein HDU96_005746 [Phlyctochytrium bullatum]